MSASPLSHAMWNALRMMSDTRAEGREPHAVAANTLDSPYLMDGQLFVDWRTAQALERRGLVRIEDGTDVYLVRVTGDCEAVASENDGSRGALVSESEET